MDQDLSKYKKPLSEIIAGILKNDIFNRELCLGERLIETELAARFDVSRSTIREALKILEQEELVTSKANKGTFIIDYTEKDMEELNEVRMLIERVAFVKALPNMKEEDFNKLQEILEEMKIEGKRENWNRLFDLDMQFHCYVINRCGNSRLIKIYESIQAQVRVYLAHLDKHYPTPMAYYNEHKKLYDALKKKDPELVENQTKQHIEFIEESMMRSE